MRRAEPVEVADDARIRMRAGFVSLAVGTGLLAVKLFAYQVTGSTAILSDAMESIVNVVAAIFALASLAFAGMPADRNHPYGHGKIEFFTAAFEGGLIAFAALLIIYEACQALLAADISVAQLDLGVGLTAAAGMINLALGAYLVRTGKACQSLTLIADGRHVISDFWTSLGIVIGLLLVKLTGLLWLDPAIAIAVGVNLAWTGLKLVRYAAGGVLDEEEVDLLDRLLRAINATSVPGIIRVHNLRAIRSGRFSHFDAHLVVPEFWPVQRAHDISQTFEKQVIATAAVSGEILFHLDPCRQAYCASCDLPDCPIRLEPFRSRPSLTIDEAVQEEEAKAERRARQAAGR
jgi:cation diffusion facilitator family transporter